MEPCNFFLSEKKKRFRIGFGGSRQLIDRHVGRAMKKMLKEGPLGLVIALINETVDLFAGPIRAHERKPSLMRGTAPKRPWRYSSSILAFFRTEKSLRGNKLVAPSSPFSAK